MADVFWGRRREDFCLKLIFINFSFFAAEDFGKAILQASPIFASIDQSLHGVEVLHLGKLMPLTQIFN